MGSSCRFFIASGDPSRGERDQREVLRVLTSEASSDEKIALSFYQKTKALIDEKSFTLTDKTVKSVDIVDALRFVPIRWVASEIVSYHVFLAFRLCRCSLRVIAIQAGIPLKTEHQHGVYTEAQLFDMLTDIYT